MRCVRRFRPTQSLLELRFGRLSFCSVHAEPESHHKLRVPRRDRFHPARIGMFETDSRRSRSVILLFTLLTS